MSESIDKSINTDPAPDEWWEKVKALGAPVKSCPVFYSVEEVLDYTNYYEDEDEESLSTTNGRMYADQALRSAAVTVDSISPRNGP